MRTSIFFLSSLALLIPALVSCEKTIPVNIPPHERQIVAKGLFSADSLWRVDVRSSVGFQDAAEPFPLTNATVEVWEGGTLLERLHRISGGVYQARQTRPTTGALYTLRITAPDYASVEAEGMLPVTLVTPRVSVDTVRNDIGFTQLNVSLTLDDPVEQANYYAIDVLQEVTTYNQLTPRTNVLPTGFESADVILNDLAIEAGDTFFRTAYFEDALFNGQTQTLSLTVQEPFLQGEGPATNIKVTLRFYVTTETFFRYHKTLELQDNLSENPFSEPVRVQSNTSNGFGVFAGYQAQAFVLSDRRVR